MLEGKIKITPTNKCKIFENFIQWYGYTDGQRFSIVWMFWNYQTIKVTNHLFQIIGSKICTMYPYPLNTCIYLHRISSIKLIFYAIRFISITSFRKEDEKENQTYNLQIIQIQAQRIRESNLRVGRISVISSRRTYVEDDDVYI